MRQFIYFKKDGSPSKPVGLSALVTAAGIRLVVGTGPFTLTQDGDPVSAELPRAKLLDRLRRRLSIGDIGPVYRVRNAKGNVIFRCREVAPALSVIDTTGNDKADLYWSSIKAEFGEFKPQFAGAYVCKTVAGSATMSQHSYGNAVDIFFDSMAHQEKVAAWVVAHDGEFNVEHVISGDRIWTRGVGWHSYGGDFHSHLHVDFTPNFSGACGVRNT